MILVEDNNSICNTHVCFTAAHLYIYMLYSMLITKLQTINSIVLTIITDSTKTYGSTHSETLFCLLLKLFSPQGLGDFTEM